MNVAPFFLLIFLTLQKCFHVVAVLNTTSNTTTLIFNPDTPLDKLPAGKPGSKTFELSKKLTFPVACHENNAGTVLLMFSKKYCTGQGTAIIHNFCHHLGFDEWQV
jgi:hypothetical protein